MPEPDLSSWLSQHDLVYRKKPTSWDEGYHLANGDMGVVLWFTETAMVISLDKRDIDETSGPPADFPPHHSWQSFVQRMDAGDKKGAEAVLTSAGHVIFHPAVGRLVVDLGGPIEAFTGRFRLDPL